MTLQRGITADTVRDFEQFINKKYAKELGKRPLTVFMIPTTRDQLLPARIALLASLCAVLAACWLFTLASPVHGQDIEPRSYSNAPVGVNFLISGYAYTRGGLAFDPALPITDVHLQTSSAVMAYVRSLDFWGKSGKFDVIVPYSWLSGSAEYAGETLRRHVNGFTDSRFRVSVNLYGAPALTLDEFRAYRQDLIVGASLQISVPWGQYDSERLVNLSSNRWWFKPEIGISKAIDNWTFELAVATTFYTDNSDFYGGNVRSQKPLYATQAHVIYAFPSGMWLAINTTFFAGGRTTVNGELDNNLQQNWRVGGTFAFPVDARSSIKLYASSGVAARTGNNFDLLGVAWQYRWGGGL